MIPLKMTEKTGIWTGPERPQTIKGCKSLRPHGPTLPKDA